MQYIHTVPATAPECGALGANPMKIDIGNGKILGTKKVSANGQVSGFTEFAGKELLVILPDGEPEYALGPKDYVAELEVAANEHMKLAFRQYKELKRRFETPERATLDFLNKRAPKTFAGLVEKVDAWVNEQVDATEKRIEKALDGRTAAKEQ